MIFDISVQSSVWKNGTTTKRQIAWIKRWSIESILLFGYIFCADLGTMGIFCIRSVYDWKAKYPVWSECFVAYWIHWTVLSNVSTSQPNSSVRFSSFFWRLSMLTHWLFFILKIRFTESDILALKRIYANYTKVQSFIDNYDEKDIAAISLDTNSTSLWTISPPNLRRFKNTLHGNVTIKFRFTISISRLSYDQFAERVETSQVIYLTAEDVARQELLNALNKNIPDRHVHLVNLFPKFLKVWINRRSKFSEIKCFRLLNWMSGYELQRLTTSWTIEITKW